MQLIKESLVYELTIRLVVTGSHGNAQSKLSKATMMSSLSKGLY